MKLENDYLQKYLKYKTKYFQLRNQIGGTITLDMVSNMTSEDFIQYIRSPRLRSVVTDSHYYTMKEFFELNTSDEALYSLLFYLFARFDNKFLNTKDYGQNMESYFHTIEGLVDICKLMYTSLNAKMLPDKHTILLLPGDSPTYIFRIIEFLYPDIHLRDKVHIEEFPLSKLNAAALQQIDPSTYMEHILRRYVDIISQSRIIIFDYSDSGGSYTSMSNAIHATHRIDIQLFNINEYFKSPAHLIKITDKDNEDVVKNIALNIKNLSEVIDFLVSDETSYKRCQYMMPLAESLPNASGQQRIYPHNATDYLLQGQSLTYHEYFSTYPNVNNYHFSCNALIYAFYMFINVKDIKDKTVVFHNTLQSKIKSLYHEKRLIIRIKQDRDTEVEYSGIFLINQRANNYEGIVKTDKGYSPKFNLFNVISIMFL